MSTNRLPPQLTEKLIIGRSLGFLALRELVRSQTRTILSASAVALGVAMMIATDLLSSALLNVLSDSEIAQSFGQGLFEQMKIMLQMVGVSISRQWPWTTQLPQMKTWLSSSW